MNSNMEYGDWYHNYSDGSLHLCPVLREQVGMPLEGSVSDLLSQMKVLKGKRVLSLIKDSSAYTKAFELEVLEFELNGKRHYYECYMKLDIVNGKEVGCFGNARRLKEPVTLHYPEAIGATR